MGREIKFRAWSEDKKVMIYDSKGEQPWGSDPDYIKVMHDGILFADSPDMGHYGGGDWSYSNGRYEIMQYTGLNDKNGKEIYEGDILLWEKKGLSVKVKVQFKEGMFLAGDMPLYDCLDEKIIGNIYENPELIEV